MHTQRQVFLAFFKPSIFGYGGGPASIPLIYKEVVENYKWLSDEEFADILALSNTLPGPIATKLSGYIGYRIKGFSGMINGILATVLPTIILMIVLLTSLSSIKEFDWVKGMTAAVIPVIGIMLATLTWQFIDKAAKGMGWIQTLLMSIGVLIFLHFLNVHPGIIIGVLLVFSLAQKEEAKPDKEREDISI